jgi:hypothetical protein
MAIVDLLCLLANISKLSPPLQIFRIALITVRFFSLLPVAFRESEHCRDALLRYIVNKTAYSARLCGA